MPDLDPRAGLFAALLKHWRGQRGLSQLDLALAADVSARHISFLETGRSNPTPEMVVRLGTTLGVPLRQVNAMLQAAGHPPQYETSAEGMPPLVHRALELLQAHHEPYPLLVVDRTYRVRDMNRGGAAVLGALAAGTRASAEPNLARMTFDPEGVRPFVVNFDEVGRALLWRLQREVLADPNDRALRGLLEDLLAMPSVSPDWRRVDLSVPSDPALVVHLRRGALDLRFLTMVTAFQAPQNVAVEELRVETWFPVDPETAAAVRALHGRFAGGQAED